jgi:nucleotide-binding universal stress UspA family protein
MKILVGYDGSNAAREALSLAVKHATAFQAAVHVVTSHVGGGAEHVEDIETAEHVLEYAKKLFEAEGIPCETHLLIRGLTPGEDLVEFAKEEQIDQIIVGVKKRSKVDKLVFGSTCQFVILNAPCPVLTVK